MPRFTTAAALALGLAASASAQSAAVTGSVISVFLLDTDPESLVGSLIGTSGSMTTLAVQCAPGVDAASCGYPSPVTVTAGPSTVHASASISGIAAEYGCTLTGTTTGACSITYVGAASDLATDAAQASTATGITTVSTSGTIAATDITYYPVTLTAGSGVSALSTVPATASASGSAASSGAASNASVPPVVASSAQASSAAVSGSAKSSATGAVASASSAASSASKSASGAASAATSSVSSAVATFSAGAAKVIAPSAFAAALLGLAAFL